MTHGSVLASPLAIGRVMLGNRFVSAPMERNYCQIDGTVTDRYIDYLARRARGGAALVFSEASYVRADGKGRLRQMGVDVDERIPGIARLADRVHGEGALVGVELNHGGRTTRSAVTGLMPVAPSPVPCPPVGGEMPSVLETEEVYELVQCYAEAAVRCQEAGVDVVSLHGGHGYLIHQFLSPAYNLRSDEFADPVLFLNLVIAAVRKAAPGVTLGLRFSAFEGISNGLDAAGTLDRMRRADVGALDFLDVSAGNYEAGQWIVQSGEWERGLLGRYAQAYRAFGIPVGVAGRISTPQAAERIVREGQADFVSMARTLHADPDFPARALDGGRYRPCIACNHCIDSLGSGEPIPCTVNPWVGRESEEHRAAPERPIHVRVIGAGPAGLAVATDLARLGAAVDVHEARGCVGGDFALASYLHAYPEYGRLVEWYAAELAHLAVVLHLGSTVTREQMLTWRDTDAIVLATGGVGSHEGLPATDGREVLDVRDWLALGREAPSHITLYGADRDGAALADDLAARGSTVTLIGPQPSIAADVGHRAKMLVVPRLLEHPAVHTYLDATLLAVEHDRVRIRQPDGDAWIPASGPLVVSLGTEPRRDLLQACRDAAPRLGVWVVGDASGDGGSVHAALRTATRAVGEILSSTRSGFDGSPDLPHRPERRGVRPRPMNRPRGLR